MEPINRDEQIVTFTIKSRTNVCVSTFSNGKRNFMYLPYLDPWFWMAKTHGSYAYQAHNKRRMDKLISTLGLPYRYNKGYMTRDGNQGPFMYQNLLDKSVCIDEETDIVPQNEQTRKLIMEGATIEVPVKNQDNAKLHRIPMFISTNHSLGKWISPMGYAAILNRMYLFKIDAVIGVDLEKPECEITFSDWWKCVRECQVFKKNTKRGMSRKPKSKKSEMETEASEEVEEA